MEPNGNDKIAEISEQIVNLLKDHGEVHWSLIIDNIHNEYLCSDSRSETVKKFIIIMHGGMGSFLDLVLHKDRKPLISENNKLDDLRHKLYEECKKAI